VSHLASTADVIARALADHPEEVSVSDTVHRHVTLLEVTMAPGDLGRAIGRQGRTAAAFRTLVALVAEREGKHAQLEFRGAPDGPR
jgi:predicted RNA-binding protein YlqC (UPF0109 family)